MCSEKEYKHEAFQLRALPNQKFQISTPTYEFNFTLSLKDLENIKSFIDRQISIEHNKQEAEKLRIQNQRQHKLF